MKKILCLPALVFFLASCERLFIKDESENTPVNNFEILWKDFDENYSFFTYKNINWDSLHAVYRPQVGNDMGNEELFTVFDEMLFHLRDGHVNLSSRFNTTRYAQYFLQSPPNFDYNLLERHYFKNQERITEGGAYRYLKMDSIGYIYVPSFAAGNYHYIDLVLDHFSEVKGIIVDVRDNGGGDPVNAEILAARFNVEGRIYAHWLWKDGPGHDDFTDPIPYGLGTIDHPFLKPVVVLTNRSTFSAANDFVLMMDQIPHVTILGDTTGGGGGVPYTRELLNGWRYRFSRTITLSPSGENVEFGIPPDWVVNLDTADILEGKDTMIETAIDLIGER